MAAPNHRPAAGRSLLVRAGALGTALLAAVGLVLLPSAAGGGQAHADSAADSAVTETGTKGVYDDFSELKVTVEQTRGVRSQGLKVSWSGGKQTVSTGGVYTGNYLQIMQCWGDAPGGPAPEQCEFGNPPNGTPVQNGSRKTWAKDPQEPVQRVVPFTTVTGTSTTTDLNQFFTAFTSNEQDVAMTGADGSGETIFQTEDSAISQHLGCGEVEQAGQAPAPCWLVVVPRGTHEPNGDPPGSLGLLSSALSAGNWAQRIVFRLDFHPTDSPCPIGQNEQPTTGSELASSAMDSWEPKLCTTDRTTYVFVPQDEDTSRTQILDPPEGTAGLAFVEDPVPPQAGAPPVVHAPVAVSGLVIGYNVQVQGSSQQVPRIRLNARLVAKMLTESYLCEIPGYPGDVTPGRLPAGNAKDISGDPEFQALNEGVKETSLISCGLALGVPQGESDAAAQLWRWLRSDPDAADFLSGKPDPWGMKINPYSLELDPAHTALAKFDKPDPTVLVPDQNYPDIKVTAVGLNPYGNNLADDARMVRAANNGGSGRTIPPDLVPPALSKTDPQAPGNHFVMGLTDAAGAARYRLGTAELLNADGQFVAPTVDGLTKAVAGMKDGGVPGVLDADPALRTPGAYPLTTVTYAAASTSMDAARRRTYAGLIRYAADAGQQPGIGDGQLPPGYAPLSPALRDQALAAASALVAGVPPTTPADAGTSGAGAGTGGRPGRRGRCDQGRGGRLQRPAGGRQRREGRRSDPGRAPRRRPLGAARRPGRRCRRVPGRSVPDARGRRPRHGPPLFLPPRALRRKAVRVSGTWVPLGRKLKKNSECLLFTFPGRSIWLLHLVGVGRMIVVRSTGRMAL